MPRRPAGERSFASHRGILAVVRRTCSGQPVRTKPAPDRPHRRSLRADDRAVFRCPPACLRGMDSCETASRFRAAAPESALNSRPRDVHGDEGPRSIPTIRRSLGPPLFLRITLILRGGSCRRRWNAQLLARLPTRSSFRSGPTGSMTGLPPLGVKDRTAGDTWGKASTGRRHLPGTPEQFTFIQSVVQFAGFAERCCVPFLRESCELCERSVIPGKPR
jgi:hypothetical protein